MLQPGTYRIDIPQGLSWSMSIQWLVGEPETPVDLSGYSAVLEIRERQNNTAEVMEQLTSPADITLDEFGNITARMTPSATALLPLGSYWYELELSAGNGGEIVQLLRGEARVSP